MKLHGDGFIVTPQRAEFLGLGKRPGLDEHIRRYRNGRDLTAIPRGVMVIDLIGLTDEEVRQRFPEVYQHVLQSVRYKIGKDGNGLNTDERLAVRKDRMAPFVQELEAWLREERGKLSAKSPVAKTIHYSLRRWDAMTRFLGDGRICMSNNAAERAIRGIAVGRNNWTFAGSDRGGERAAAIYTLIETCKLNSVEPRAWLADVLSRLQDYRTSRIDELLPWNWKKPDLQAKAA